MADWEDCHRNDQGEYQRNPLWEANGIGRNAGTGGEAIDPYYPWTCNLCFKSKKFCTLADSIPHLSQEKHRNRIWETYLDRPPAVPRWPPRDGAVPARMASGESASLSWERGGFAEPVPPPPPVWPCKPPSASVPQGHPPTPTTQFESNCWCRINSTTGGSAADAAPTVNITRMTTTTMQTSIPCKAPPAYHWGTPGSCARLPPPRVDLQDPTGYPSAHPAYKAPPPPSRAKAVFVPGSESLCVPTPADVGTFAPASSPRPASRTSWVGMAGVVAKPWPPTPAASCPVGADGPPQSPPRTSPKPPPPMPPPFGASDGAPSAAQVPMSRWWGAPAVVPSHSVASAHAAMSCGAASVSGKEVLEGEEGQETSK